MAKRAAMSAALVLAGVVGVAGLEPAAAGGSSDWKQVDAGTFHTCGVTTSGQLFCWGSDLNGQLGDSPGDDSSATPIPVEGAATNWQQVTAGTIHTCARKTSGRLYCWGDDTFGQLGDDTIGPNTAIPGRVTGGSDWRQITAGQGHTCARKTNARLFCWGDDTHGQLGDGTAGTPNEDPTPAEVVPHP